MKGLRFAAAGGGGAAAFLCFHLQAPCPAAEKMVQPDPQRAATKAKHPADP